jgi:hypothetical protein
MVIARRRDTYHQGGGRWSPLDEELGLDRRLGYSPLMNYLLTSLGHVSRLLKLQSYSAKRWDSRSWMCSRPLQWGGVRKLRVQRRHSRIILCADFTGDLANFAWNPATLAYERTRTNLWKAPSLT